jgi:hypothetical protein
MVTHRLVPRPKICRRARSGWVAGLRAHAVSLASMLVACLELLGGWPLTRHRAMGFAARGQAIGLGELVGIGEGFFSIFFV